MLISQLPNIVQKSFCTLDEDMDLTFQMNYVTVFYHVCSLRYQAKIVGKFSEFFLTHPLYLENEVMGNEIKKEIKVKMKYWYEC